MQEPQGPPLPPPPGGAGGTGSKIEMPRRPGGLLSGVLEAAQVCTGVPVPRGHEEGREAAGTAGPGHSGALSGEGRTGPVCLCRVGGQRLSGKPRRRDAGHGVEGGLSVES